MCQWANLQSRGFFPHTVTTTTELQELYTKKKKKKITQHTHIKIVLQDLCSNILCSALKHDNDTSGSLNGQYCYHFSIHRYCTSKQIHSLHSQQKRENKLTQVGFQFYHLKEKNKMSRLQN